MTSRRRPSQHRRRRAVTLLELVLALSISVLVMVAISMAVHLNLKTLDSRRAEVEEAQLARAVLRMITDDLRSTVQNEVVDFSGVDQMVSGVAGDASALLASMGGGAAGSGATLGGAPAGASGEATGGASGGASGSSASTNSQDIADSEAPPDIPGLYGNQNELQVDVSRLPRVDEYSSLITAEGVTKIPSDVKTVAYYVRTQPMDGSDERQDAIMPGISSRGAGLVRRELPRAITKYAIANALGENMLKGGDLIAPEVTAINFRYYDGQEWLLEWDSELMEGLPLAVEIVMSVRSSRAEEEAARAATTSLMQQPPPDLIYRVVVRIPSAQLGKVPASSEGQSTGSSGTSGGSSGSSSAAGGTK